VDDALLGLLQSVLLERLDRLGVDEVEERLATLAAHHHRVHGRALQLSEHTIHLSQQLQQRVSPHASPSSSKSRKYPADHTGVCSKTESLAASRALCSLTRDVSSIFPSTCPLAAVVHSPRSHRQKVIAMTERRVHPLVEPPTEPIQIRERRHRVDKDD
jgi:hypothetical protein